MDIQDFSELEEEMLHSGLRRGLLPSPECAEDRAIVERDPCPECGGPVRFEAYSARLNEMAFGKAQWEYHAFGVCRHCDAAFEF